MEKEHDIIGSLKDIEKVVSQKPIKISVDVRPVNSLHGWVMKKGWSPKVKIFEIKPATLITLIKISTEFLKLPKDMFSTGDILNENYILMKEHIPTMARIVAMAIVNRKKDPPNDMIELITDNFTATDLLKTILVVMNQMDVRNFTMSIISVTGMSLWNPMEIIANGKKSSTPGKSPKEPSSTSDSPTSTSPKKSAGQT